MFFAVFTAVAAGVYPQAQAGEANRITAVSVSGLKRTKAHIIETPLAKYIGMDAGDVDANDVYAIVKSTGVLEPLSVEMPDNEGGAGKTLAVSVRDKWSIFPMPIVSVNSGGWSAGAALMDANAFGVKDTMMAVGMYGKGGILAMAMYINSPDGIGDIGWNIMGVFALRENENLDQTGETVLRRYNSMVIRPLAGLSYKLGEHITPNLNVSYRYIALRETEAPVNAPEHGVQAVSVNPGINIQKDSTWDGYFLNETKAALNYEYTFVIDGADVHAVSLNAAFNHSLVPGFRFTAKSGAVAATSSASPFLASSPREAAVNILPQAYSATDFAGISLGFEKYLFKFTHGMIAVLAAYQAVYSNGDLLAHQFDHGPAAMLLMYFSRLALPALGLGGAYNVDKEAWQFAFNIGMSL
jgi:hypothetical protein